MAPAGGIRDRLDTCSSCFVSLYIEVQYSTQFACVFLLKFGLVQPVLISFSHKRDRILVE